MQQISSKISYVGGLHDKSLTAGKLRSLSEYALEGIDRNKLDVGKECL